MPVAAGVALVMAGALPMPVPVRLITVGLPTALWTIVMLPLAVPMVAGVKTMLA